MNLYFVMFAPIWLFGVAAFALGTVYALRKQCGSTAARGGTEGGTVNRPGVSVLKPLKGVDPGLAENLRSFFRLDYPIFELLLCLESPRDPAYPILLTVAQEYPHVRYRIFFSGDSRKSEFRNPKVANIENASLYASYDLHMIADSNVHIDSETFRSFVEELESPGVGIVSAIVEGVGAQGWAGALEAMALNTFYARGMRLAEFSGQACVVGKTMIYRASVLDRLGGVTALGRYLAEDFMAGFGMRQLGYRVHVARRTIRQVVGNYTFSQYWNRHVRWGRIRKAQAPFAFFAEPIMQPIPLSWLGGVLLGFSPTVVGGQLAVFYLADRLLRGRGSPRAWVPDPRDVLVWFTREAIAPVLWTATALGSEVEWRGQRLRVGFGGILQRRKV